MRAAGLLLAAIVAIAATTALAAPVGEVHVADCDRGPVTIGSGSADWRAESRDAGPLGVRQRPLGEMSRYGPRGTGQLVTKMPVLIEGHNAVSLSVPPRLAHRVFLYYGWHEDRGGGRSTSFLGYPGDSAVEFHPCTNKPRTIWPGGIRVKGRQPVQLLVTVEGQADEPFTLRLGRPKPYPGALSALLN